MIVLNVRSPYFIEVDEELQTGAKLELFIWHKPDSEPATPTYTFVKRIPSTTQTAIVFNISPYVAEFIENINAEQRSAAHQEENEVWVYVAAYWYTTTDVALKEWELVRSRNHIGVNGFNNYIDGANQDNRNKVEY